MHSTPRVQQTPSPNDLDWIFESALTREGEEEDTAASCQVRGEEDHGQPTSSSTVGAGTNGFFRPHCPLPHLV